MWACNDNLLASAQIAQLAPIVSFFYSYGIHSMLTPCFTSPEHVGKLPTSPAHASRPPVVAAHGGRDRGGVEARGGVPGFMFKGDTEGQPGPNQYNMTELEGANFFGEVLDAAVSTGTHTFLLLLLLVVISMQMEEVLVTAAAATARAAAPTTAACYRHLARLCTPRRRGGGAQHDQAIYQFRRFVDWKGKRPNVVLQTKNGPLDFQVREPVHALFGALPSVNLICEVQATQEYLGQARHLSALAPQWETYLRFELGTPPPPGRGESTTKKGAVAAGDGINTSNGRSNSSSAGMRTDTATATATATARAMTLGDRVAGGALTPFSGLAAVSNFGLDGNWTGHVLSAVNTYAFGRLAWAPRHRHHPGEQRRRRRRRRRRRLRRRVRVRVRLWLREEGHHP